MGSLDQGLTIYVTRTCHTCKRVKQFLGARGVPYQVVDLTDDAEVQQWLTGVTGRQTVPQFFVDGVWLPGGFGQLKAQYLA